jgi:hypothetical protein
MRFLSGISLLAILVVAVIVLTGSLKQSEALLGPSGNHSLAALLQTPLGKADASVDNQEFATLYEDARGDSISTNGTLTTAQLLPQLQASEPEYQVGAPAGISARVVADNFVFCAQVYTGFTCAVGNVRVGALSFGAGKSRASAQEMAIAQQQAGTGTGTGTGAITPDTSAAGGLSVLKKAQALAGSNAGATGKT